MAQRCSVDFTWARAKVYLKCLTNFKLDQGMVGVENVKLFTTMILMHSGALGIPAGHVVVYPRYHKPYDPNQESWPGHSTGPPTILDRENVRSILTSVEVEERSDGLCLQVLCAQIMEPTSLQQGSYTPHKGFIMRDRERREKCQYQETTTTSSYFFVLLAKSGSEMRMQESSRVSVSRQCCLHVETMYCT